MYRAVVKRERCIGNNNLEAAGFYCSKIKGQLERPVNTKILKSIDNTRKNYTISYDITIC